MARVLIFAAGVAAFALSASLGGGILAPAHASAPQSGENLFKSKCSVCHATTAKDGTSIGPHLFGVVGRKAGSLAGFSYSKAMKNSAVVWNSATLAKYIASPQAVIPGNRMPFPGDRNPDEVTAIVSYLGTLK
jgi:cytochrome c